MRTFEGTGVALVTPFKADKSIDYEALEGLIDHVINGGVEFLVSMGTTGESATLSKAEKVEVLEFTAGKAKGQIPVVAGVGGNNTADLLDFFKAFHFNDIEGILSVSPYYNKPAQEGIYQHYMKLSEAAPRPLILYNVPGRTGSNITAETTLRLAREAANIVAIKEASGDLEQIMTIIRDKPADFTVLSGDDPLTLPMISTGAKGVISVTANAFPRDFSGMVRQSLKGNFPEARKLHYKLWEVIAWLFADGNPSGIKAALHILGICANEFRLPVVPVRTTTYKKLKAAMHHLEGQKAKV